MIARCMFVTAARVLWLVFAILLLVPVMRAAEESDELGHGVQWLREGYEALSTEKPKHRGRKERLEYLSKVLHFIPGHWGTGWHFETHPYAERVYLRSDHLRAVVAFRRHYCGGEGYLREDSRGWRVILRDENWTE